MEEKILKQRGGKREGAGRKRVAPEGARIRSFALSDAEADNVRKYIVSMRKGETPKQVQPNINIGELQDTAFGIMVSTSKAVAGALIALNGGAPYENVERKLKDATMIGFKDAVSEYERKHKAK